MNDFRRRLQEQQAGEVNPPEPTVVSSEWVYRNFKVTSFEITSIDQPCTGMFHESGTYHNGGVTCNIAFDLDWYKRTVMSDGTIINGDIVQDHGSASGINLSTIMETTNSSYGNTAYVSTNTINKNRPTEHDMQAFYYFNPKGNQSGTGRLYHDNTKSPIGTSVTKNITFSIFAGSSTGQILTDSSYVLFSVTITKTGDNTYSYTIN